MKFKENKVVHLRGAYNDYNFGDDLLLISNLELLKKIISKDSLIYLKEENGSLEKLKYSSKFKHNHSIEISALFKGLNETLKKAKIPKIFRLSILAIHMFLVVVCLLVNKITNKSIFFKTFTNYIKQLDIVHYIGGGYFNDKWPFVVVYELVTLLLYKTIKPEIKVIGTGLGVGPFKYKLSVIFVKFFFAKFEYISVREQESLDFLASIKLFDVNLLGDDVVLLNNFMMELNGQTKRNEIFACNLKDFTDHDNSLIVEKMDELVVQLLKKGKKVEFYAFGELPGPDDEALFNKLNPEILNKVKIINPYKEGYYPFLKQLASTKYGIGFAYHFAIVTTLMNLPTINIYSGKYYKQKINGAMKFMNNSDSVISVNEFYNLDYTHVTSYVNNHRDLTENNKKLTEKLIEEYSKTYFKL